MLGRIAIVGATVATLGACVNQGAAEPALCGVAAHTADTVIAYPTGLACAGSGYGHVIVVNGKCGVLLATHAEDDVCVQYRSLTDPRHDWVITALSALDSVDGTYSRVDA